MKRLCQRALLHHLPLLTVCSRASASTSVFFLACLSLMLVPEDNSRETQCVVLQLTVTTWRSLLEWKRGDAMGAKRVDDSNINTPFLPTEFPCYPPDRLYECTTRRPNPFIDVDRGADWVLRILAQKLQNKIDSVAEQCFSFRHSAYFIKSWHLTTKIADRCENRTKRTATQ